MSKLLAGSHVPAVVMLEAPDERLKSLKRMTFESEEEWREFVWHCRQGKQTKSTGSDIISGKAAGLKDKMKGWTDKYNICPLPYEQHMLATEKATDVFNSGTTRIVFFK